MAHRWLSAGAGEGDLQKLGGWANGVVMCRYGGTRVVDREVAAYDTISPMADLWYLSPPPTDSGAHTGPHRKGA